MRDIIDGFLRFQRDIYPQRVELFKQLATSQNPKALFVTCSDSRVVPELLTQREPGELFVIRNAGNIVPSYGPEPGGVSATVEYAVAVLGVQDIVICGHSDCGAMGAISRCTCLDHLPAVANWLRHSDAAKVINAAHTFDSPRAKLDGLVRENVIAQLANLRTHPSVALALEQGRMNLHGWVYDIERGSIDALDGSTRRFVPLAESPTTVAVTSRSQRQGCRARPGPPAPGRSRPRGGCSSPRRSISICGLPGNGMLILHQQTRQRLLQVRKAEAIAGLQGPPRLQTLTAQQQH